MENLLEIQNLSVIAEQPSKSIIHGVSLKIEPKSIVGLVGGSGSGKNHDGISGVAVVGSGIAHYARQDFT